MSTTPDEPSGTSHVHWTSRQRPYSTGSDLGSITGGQASIYTQVNGSCTQILALLGRLTSASGGTSAVPHDQIEAATRQLLAELHRPDGPRPDEVKRQLGLLRDVVGEAGDMVNTVEDEQVRTEFTTLTDLITDLDRAWSNRPGRRPLS